MTSAALPPLLLFTCPRPFVGPFDRIQHNAIGSWTRLVPRPEIALFGDEVGVADACQRHGLTHRPELARNEYGTPRLDDLVLRAESLAAGRLLAFVNADIVLCGDLLPALARVAARWSEFLLLARRWDLPFDVPIEFGDPDWEASLRQRSRRSARRHGPRGMDLFVFRAGAFGEIPAFALGRLHYDRWLVWRARARGLPVIDATRAVTCFHPDHERSYRAIGAAPVEGSDDMRRSVEARRNSELAKRTGRLFDVRDATHRFGRWGLRPAWPRWRRRGWRRPRAQPGDAPR